MSAETELHRLRSLAVRLQSAQDHVRDLTDERDEIIYTLLTRHAATGDAVSEAAGVSQPRVVQIRHAVQARRAAPVVVRPMRRRAGKVAS